MRHLLRSRTDVRRFFHPGWFLMGGLLALPANADNLVWRESSGVEWAFGPQESNPANQLLQVRCKRGVVYELQTSTDLLEWTNAASTYGAGQIWERSLFALPEPPEEGEEPPPPQPAEQMNEAVLVIFAREGEGVWCTWRSLDDGAARARLLSGAALSSQWPLVFAGISNNHRITMLRGGMTNAPTGAEVSTALGTKDAAMWAAVQSGWSAFQTQVAQGNTAPASGPAQSASGVSSFWRVKAIYVDTDGDGLKDADELSEFDTNPFSVDSDGDGISDGAEILAGTDPNGHATTTDSDGDGIWDDQDADPGDTAVAWFKVAESTYGIIDLGAPANVSFSNNWECHLGESGHVLISRNREEEWPEFANGINAAGFPGSEYFVSHVWQPTTGAWSAPLTQPGNLRGVGKAIDAEGNVYGKGVGALGPNQTWPGIKNVPLRWKKQASSWTTAEVDAPGDSEVGSAFSNAVGAAASKGDSVVGPILFGGSNRIVSHSVNYLTSSSVCSNVYRIGAGESSPLFSIHPEDLSASPPVTTSCQLLNAVGEPGGWHVHSWSVEPIDPETFEPGPVTNHLKLSHLTPAVTNAQGEIVSPASVTETNAPAGDARWQLQSLASINLNRLPSNLSAAVVWATPETVLVGMRPIGGSAMTWTTSNRSNADQRIAGKTNTRGESLLGSRLWRNGKWIELSSLLPTNSGWSDIIGLDINSSGTILIQGTVAGQKRLALLPPL